MPNIVLGLPLLVVISTCSSALLWRIETSPPSYIFGTIHIPYNLVWPHISNATRQAFEASTHFYAEIDAKNDAYWDDFHQCLLNRSARERRSTTWVTEGDILDVHLSAEARRLNKTVGSLESAEYHCEREGWRYNLTTWFLILKIVKQEMRNRTHNTIDANTYLKQLTTKKYICDEINSDYIQTLFGSVDEVQQMEQRDEQMARHVHRLLQQPSGNRYFFAVGAAHMLSKHKNLIVRLKTFGYRITRVCTEQNRMRQKYGCKKKTIAKHCMKRKPSRKGKQ